MADKIDKALPNEPRKNIHVPAEEEVIEAQEEITETRDGVEVTEQEDQDQLILILIQQLHQWKAAMNTTQI